MSFEMGPALLFCPADRPERYAKAAERADAVILDLEDAVSAHEKADARANIIASELDPGHTIVRINALDTSEAQLDLEAVMQTPYRTVMVAKAEDPAAIASLDRELQILALCETAKGVVAAEAFAALDNVAGLMWGAEDLVASLGGTSSRGLGGQYRDIARYARSRVLLAAGAFGKAAIDAVHLDIADAAGLAAEAQDAAASGFTATACIHPSQVEVIRAAYAPDPATVAWASAVLEAAAGEHGVFSFEGRMVDEPVLRHARTVLSHAANA